LKKLPILLERSLVDSRKEKEEICGKFEEDLFAQGDITCRKKCSHCCYHPVAASLLEGVLLYRALKKEGLWTAALKAEVDRVAKLTTGLPPETWMVSQIACPLLRDNLCIAYKARPFLCRATWSKGVPDQCHPHRFSQKTQIVSKRAESLRFQTVERALSKQLGIRYQPLPLMLALQLGERLATQKMELTDSDREIWKEFIQAWA
jgi:Fe-S-cluster containining protein